MGLKLRFNTKGKSSKNLDGFTEVLQQYSIKMSLYGASGVKKAADMLLKWSQELVPVDTGELKRSGKVVKITDSASSARMVYQVQYEALAPWGNSSTGTFNYAWIQHEDLTLRHPNGGQAKYLEFPYRSNKQLLMSIIKEATKKGMEAR